MREEYYLNIHIVVPRGRELILSVDYTKDTLKELMKEPLGVSICLIVHRDCRIDFKPLRQELNVYGKLDVLEYVSGWDITGKVLRDCEQISCEFVCLTDLLTINACDCEFKRYPYLMGRYIDVFSPAVYNPQILPYMQRWLLKLKNRICNTAFNTCYSYSIGPLILKKRLFVTQQMRYSFLLNELFLLSKLKLFKQARIMEYSLGLKARVENKFFTQLFARSLSLILILLPYYLARINYQLILHRSSKKERSL